MLPALYYSQEKHSPRPNKHAQTGDGKGRQRIRPADQDGRSREQSHCQGDVQDALLGIVDVGEQTKLLIDFSNVKFLSSSFLGCLVKVLKRIREKNGQLTLCKIDPKILKVFQITRLDQAFDIV